jgi:hypothetical protein
VLPMAVSPLVNKSSPMWVVIRFRITRCYLLRYSQSVKLRENALHRIFERQFSLYYINGVAVSLTGFFRAL